MVDRVTAAPRRLERHGEELGAFAGALAGALTTALAALEEHFPDYIEADRWHQAVEGGRRFLSQWGEQAIALGWTADDLFGLAEPPERPSPFYRRLSRLDTTGLIWILRGRPVIALTADAAVIVISNGGRLSFYKNAFLAEGRARA